MDIVVPHDVLVNGRLQQDLKNKLDELSTMYEEVSVRLEHLKEAYTTAEDEVCLST